MLKALDGTSPPRTSLLGRLLNFIAEPRGHFGGQGLGEAEAQPAVDLLGGVAKRKLLLAQRHDGKAVSLQDGNERIGAPAQEVVGRVVEGVHAGLPAEAVGDADCDEAAGTEAGADFGQEGRRIGLMLEDVEESDDVKNLVGIMRAERFEGERENARARTKAGGETRSAGIEFDARSGIAREIGGEQKVTGATADVEQAAAARREVVGEKETVAGLEWKKALVALGVHGGIPASIRHFAGIPELQAAAGALVKGAAMKGFQNIVEGDVETERTVRGGAFGRSGKTEHGFDDRGAKSEDRMRHETPPRFKLVKRRSDY